MPLYVQLYFNVSKREKEEIEREQEFVVYIIFIYPTPLLRF